MDRDSFGSTCACFNVETPKILVSFTVEKSQKRVKKDHVIRLVSTMSDLVNFTHLCRVKLFLA